MNLTEIRVKYPNVVLDISYSHTQNIDNGFYGIIIVERIVVPKEICL